MDTLPDFITVFLGGSWLIYRLAKLYWAYLTVKDPEVDEVSITVRGIVVKKKKK